MMTDDVRTFALPDSLLMRVTNRHAAMLWTGERPDDAMDAPPAMVGAATQFMAPAPAGALCIDGAKILAMLPAPAAPSPEDPPCAACDDEGTVQCTCCDGTGDLDCSTPGCDRFHRCNCDGGSRECRACAAASAMRARALAPVPVVRILGGCFDAHYLRQLAEMGSDLRVWQNMRSEFEPVHLCDGTKRLVIMPRRAGEGEMADRVVGAVASGGT